MGDMRGNDIKRRTSQFLGVLDLSPSFRSTCRLCLLNPATLQDGAIMVPVYTYIAHSSEAATASGPTGL